MTMRFSSLGAFFDLGKMSEAEIKKTVDLLTASRATTLPGLVNINTAPQEVLMCLPGLEQSDADAIINQRNNEPDLSTIGWVYDAGLAKAKVNGILNSITTRSYQYSADIVAVSPDGRAFKRVRIVVDAQSLPAKVVYRRELTFPGLAAHRRRAQGPQRGKSVAKFRGQLLCSAAKLKEPMIRLHYNKVLGLALGERSLLAAEVSGGVQRRITRMAEFSYDAQDLATRGPALGKFCARMVFRRGWRWWGFRRRGCCSRPRKSRR